MWYNHATDEVMMPIVNLVPFRGLLLLFRLTFFQFHLKKCHQTRTENKVRLCTVRSVVGDREYRTSHRP